MVPSVWLNSAMGLSSNKCSRCLGLMRLSSMFWYTPSSEPKVCIRESAVFSPMPFTPGMLSEAVSYTHLFSESSLPVTKLPLHWWRTDGTC